MILLPLLLPLIRSAVSAWRRRRARDGGPAATDLLPPLVDGAGPDKDAAPSRQRSSADQVLALSSGAGR